MEVNRNHWNMHSLLRIIEHYILRYFFVKQIARFGRLQQNHFFVLPKCKKKKKTAKRLTLLLPIKCFICSCICRCDANAIELQLMSNAPSELIWYFLLHLLFAVADAWYFWLSFKRSDCANTFTTEFASWEKQKILVTHSQQLLFRNFNNSLFVYIAITRTPHAIKVIVVWLRVCACNIDEIERASAISERCTMTWIGRRNVEDLYQACGMYAQ